MAITKVTFTNVKDGTDVFVFTSTMPSRVLALQEIDNYHSTLSSDYLRGKPSNIGRDYITF